MANYNSGSEHRPLYRSRDGLILGVCKGLATHLDISVFWVRTITVLTALFTGGWVVIGLYVLAAILMKKEPVIAVQTTTEQEFYNSVANNRHMALQRIKRSFDNLERRIRRVEDQVTSRERDWHARLNDNA